MSCREHINKKWKNTWTWQLSGQACADFLQGILDYLIIKRPIANLALRAFYARTGLSKEDSEVVISEARLLNLRGVEPQ